MECSKCKFWDKTNNTIRKYKGELATFYWCTAAPVDWDEDVESPMAVADHSMYAAELYTASDHYCTAFVRAEI